MDEAIEIKSERTGYDFAENEFNLIRRMIMLKALHQFQTYEQFVDGSFSNANAQISETIFFKSGEKINKMSGLTLDR